MSADLYPAVVQAPDAGQPLVFAFHGTGGDEHQLFETARQLVPGGGVVSPRGDVIEGGAARFFRRSGAQDYDQDDLARATDKMVAFVAAHRAMHRTSPAYAFGYSNGANILAAVILMRPDLFERVGLLHPYVTWRPDRRPDLVGRRLLVTAGRRDTIAPWSDTQTLIAWLEATRAQVGTEVHDGGHELRNSELTALAGVFQDG